MTLAAFTGPAKPASTDEEFTGADEDLGSWDEADAFDAFDALEELEELLGFEELEETRFNFKRIFSFPFIAQISI